MDIGSNVLTRGALAVGLILTAAGCTITPIEEVQSPTTVPVVEAEPDQLAFSDEPDTRAAPAQAPAATGPASALLEAIDPAPWTQVTNSARIGAHSSPDTLFTRLGVLEPGAGVLATGRRVETNGVQWMEIRWGVATAWVIEAAFAPAD